ncbi:MAG: class I SAM-dependent methyltransferase [Leptolinea sp.]|nr:class I SAM-dependent methyltransferase [Leptolinea sp.]
MKISFDHFDFLAPIYEKFIHPHEMEEFWRIVDLPSEGYLLDAGGGTGRVSQYARDSGCTIVVSDLSLPMLREAAGKGCLYPAVTQVEQMPFSSRSFNRVIMVDALHHVFVQKNTIEELWRLIKPGGSIVILEPNIEKFTIKLLALAEKIALMRSHFLSVDEVLSFLPDTQAEKTVIRLANDYYIKITRRDKPNS